MSWMLFIKRALSAKKANSLADLIARRSRPIVWFRVRDRVGQFSLAEARGYIHARAIDAVRTEGQAALQDAPNEAWLSETVVELALDLVTRLVLADVLKAGAYQGVRRLAA